jgi:3-methyl-2-oxobutanoate hydroxymethyltransferase
MPRIYDFNLEVHDRFATVASILALKASGEKMVEVTATSAEDAIAAEAAGIEMVVADPACVTAVREGSKRLFLTSAIDFVPTPPVTEDEVLRAAMTAMEQGADAVHTSRRPQTIRRLTDECIPVMCHVGFVPRKSNLLGGIRAVGKTAEEALQIWDEIRRLEDAGAFAVECELIASQMLSEITKRTSMATISLGSGIDGDIIGLFTSDVCGEGAHIPRHARVYADLNALYEKIRQERQRALAAFSEDVRAGQFPSDKESIRAGDDEVSRFVDALEKGS